MSSLDNNLYHYAGWSTEELLEEITELKIRAAIDKQSIAAFERSHTSLLKKLMDVTAALDVGL